MWLHKALQRGVACGSTETNRLQFVCRDTVALFVLRNVAVVFVLFSDMKYKCGTKPEVSKY